MALRRRDKNDRQLNRGNVRRPGGRTAEFFDLRETDTGTGTDKNYGNVSSGGAAVLLTAVTGTGQAEQILLIPADRIVSAIAWK